MNSTPARLRVLTIAFGKGALVPGRVHDRPEIDGVLDRQLVGIADADDPFGRIATKEERRQGDREDDGFEMPRRYGNNQPFGLATHDAFGPVDHSFDQPGFTKTRSGETVSKLF